MDKISTSQTTAYSRIPTRPPELPDSLEGTEPPEDGSVPLDVVGHDVAIAIQATSSSSSSSASSSSSVAPHAPRLVPADQDDAEPINNFGPMGGNNVAPLPDNDGDEQAPTAMQQLRQFGHSMLDLHPILADGLAVGGLMAFATRGLPEDEAAPLIIVSTFVAAGAGAARSAIALSSRVTPAAIRLAEQGILSFASFTISGVSIGGVAVANARYGFDPERNATFGGLVSGVLLGFILLVSLTEYVL